MSVTTLKQNAFEYQTIEKNKLLTKNNKDQFVQLNMDNGDGVYYIFRSGRTLHAVKEYIMNYHFTTPSFSFPGTGGSRFIRVYGQYTITNPDIAKPLTVTEKISGTKTYTVLQSKTIPFHYNHTDASNGSFSKLEITADGDFTIEGDLTVVYHKQ